MNLKNLFITDTVEFESRRLELEELFHCNATLPDQVFREGFKFFACEEFDLAITDKFWPVIQELAQASRDDNVLVGALDPDPSSYFKKHFGFYNWANIPVSISSDAYLHLLNEYPDTSPADCLGINSETVFWIPRSGKWAIWGSRGWGTCVVGFRRRIPKVSLHGLRWALDINLTYCFRYSTVPSDFREKFWSNYGNSDWEDRPLQMVIGGIDLVKGKVHGASGAMVSVSKELEPELERTRFLGDAPFKVIRLTICFGTQWGKPDFSGINERYGELEAGIELPMSEVRNLDNRPLPPAVLMPTTPLEYVFRKAALQVLVAVAQNYKLDPSVWEEKLASLPLPPRLPERRSPPKVRRWWDCIWP